MLGQHVKHALRVFVAEVLSFSHVTRRGVPSPLALHFCLHLEKDNVGHADEAFVKPWALFSHFYPSILRSEMTLNKDVM